MFENLTLSQKIAFGFGLGAIIIVSNSVMLFTFLNKSYQLNYELISNLDQESTEIDNVNLMNSISAMNNRTKIMVLNTSIISVMIMIAIGFVIARGVSMQKQIPGDQRLKNEIVSIRDMLDSIIRKI